MASTVVKSLPDLRFLITNGKNDVIREVLDKYNFPEEDLKAAVKHAIEIEAFESVKVIMKHPKIDCSFHVIPLQSSRSSNPLLELIPDDNKTKLVSILKKNSCSRDHLIQALFEAGDKEAYHCLQALVHNAKVPVDVRDKDSKSILQIILEPYSKLPYKTVKHRNLILDIVNTVCRKLETNHMENVVQDKEMNKELSKDVNDVLGCDSLEDFWQFEVYHDCILEDFAQDGSPLMYAVQSGDETLVQSLLDYRSNITDRSILHDFEQKNAPVLAALKNKQIPILKTLLETCTYFSTLMCTVNIDFPDFFYDAPVAQYITDMRFKEGDSQEVLNILATHSSPENPLSISDIHVLFKHGSSQNISDFLDFNLNGFPPKKESLQKFVSTNNKKNRKDLISDILGAAIKGKPEHLRMFLENVMTYKIDLNAKVSHMSSLAHYTHSDVPQILSHYYKGEQSLTPLQAVLRVGRPDYLSILLECGVDTDYDRPYAFPPICHIMEYMEPEGITCYKQILRYGCNLDKTFKLEKRNKTVIRVSVLDYFMICSNLFVCEMLWKCGATKYNASIDRFLFDKIKLLSDAPLEDQITDAEIADFRSSVFKKKWSLAHMARKALRDALKRDIERKVNEMELPKHVKNFINLEELDSLESDYSRYKSQYQFPDYFN